MNNYHHVIFLLISLAIHLAQLLKHGDCTVVEYGLGFIGGSNCRTYESEIWCKDKILEGPGADQRAKGEFIALTHSLTHYFFITSMYCLLRHSHQSPPLHHLFLITINYSCASTCNCKQFFLIIKSLC